ncbi:uncharacterized protein LOC106870194 [Octopus bimaculoides]|uniref:Uncharacterized protein n=1 Tax=Octopus bimaculoides TaxID=37653 RepID=A0A0L8HK11_OCTBM|nr:uncharacterized protein LOC106870194 [Octopus bimaculoides]|eukprot:XP_014771686.1 PREDICTED: uncharacterized protein LOC106870194 [Octopus bimaculoides]
MEVYLPHTIRYGFTNTYFAFVFGGTFTVEAKSGLYQTEEEKQDSLCTPYCNITNVTAASVSNGNDTRMALSLIVGLVFCVIIFIWGARITIPMIIKYLRYPRNIQDVDMVSDATELQIIEEQQSLSIKETNHIPPLATVEKGETYLLAAA